MLKVITISSAILLAGCVTDTAEQQAAPKASLADLKQMILSSKDRYWKDASSIRGARIGTTSACIAFGDCACIEANAKNGMGGYTGLRTLTVVYSGRQITDIRQPKDLETCTIVEDFSELNGRT